MRNILKNLAGQLPIDIYQRLLAYSIIKNEFPQSLGIPVLSTRHDLWNFAIQHHVNHKAKIAYMEFGVWQGESINYFAACNENEESIFVGLDSFEGLPENWGHMPKGTFGTNGIVPLVNDKRIHFVKGWFQDSWDDANLLITSTQDSDLLIHYDADLYSSTLFALTKIDSFRKAYYAIFDEFTGHETRALYNYCQAFGATVEFLAKTVLDKTELPCQLLCRIMPRSCQ